MNPELLLKLSALLTALTAITVEDLNTIKSASELGPDVAANIESFQNLANLIDQDTIDKINKARQDAGLPSV